jgi:hypothetical protein
VLTPTFQLNSRRNAGCAIPKDKGGTEEPMVLLKQAPFGNSFDGACRCQRSNVVVVIVVEKNRKTGDYDHENDNDNDKAELSSLPAQTKLMPLGEKTLSAGPFPDGR